MTIPKVIYQSWKTDPSTLPPRLALARTTVLNLNPSYRYEFYDDQRCRLFLEDHFGLDYVEAFDSLVPGAFKCDLWRYAVLYVHGGVYIDLDLAPLVPLDRIISSSDELVSATDRRIFSHIPKNAIYQAFLACKPRHPVMKIALELSFENIKRRKRASKDTAFDVTGPVVMGRALNKWWGKLELSEIKPGVSRGAKLLEFEPSGKWIIFGGLKVFEQVVGEGENDKPSDYYTKVGTYHPRVKEKIFPWIIFLPLVLVLVLTLKS